MCNYCHSALTWEAKLHSGKSVYCSCKGTIYRSRCSRAWLNQSQLVTVECKNMSKSLKPTNTGFTWSTAPRQGTGQESIPQVWFERQVCVDLGKVVGIVVFGTGGLMKSLARLYILCIIYLIQWQYVIGGSWATSRFDQKSRGASQTCKRMRMENTVHKKHAEYQR